jgi:hypothetical protein
MNTATQHTLQLHLMKIKEVEQFQHASKTRSMTAHVVARLKAAAEMSQLQATLL